MTNAKLPMNRRLLLSGGAAVIGTSMLATPTILRAQDRKLRVGAFGGYFNDAFTEGVYPAFTQATGIEIESIAQPTSEVWLVQILNSARAGKAPADVSMLSGISLTRAIREEALQAYDLSRVPNLKSVSESFIARDPSEGVRGAGATAWYTTLCTNTDEYPDAPDSWAALWDTANAGKIAALALPTSAFLLETTAKTYFAGDTDILDSRDGIVTVFEKLEEMVPNVLLWYRDDGQFQTALQSGEIPMGQFFHDVTLLAAEEGFPVRSTFPKEGGVVDFGSWVIPNAVEAVDEAHIFVDFMSDPATQALITRSVFTAPVVPRGLTDLTSDEFNAVASEIDPIVPRHDIYDTHRDWINDRWNQMIS